MDVKRLQCFAHGREGDWEAICVDLDIAVQGRSFEEVMRTLEAAILTYVEEAQKEDQATARRLLARKTPFWIRLNLAFGYFMHTAFGGRRSPECRAGFDLPCPA